MPDTPVAGPAGVYTDTRQAIEAATTGVAWPAVLGGALAALALTLILLALGSGFGLTTVSPWPNSGASVTSFTIITAVWLIITQWLASGVGGYVTGRLRTKWVGLHTHEVFFRDTANGFLAWATASVVGAMLLASVTSSVVSGTAHMLTGVASGAAVGASQGAAQSANSGPEDPTAYFVDGLYRSDRPNGDTSDASVRAESGRILLTGMRDGDVSGPDKAYLAKLVAARTGLSEQDAQKRVDDVIAQEKAAEAKARDAADKARKAAANVSIFTGLSMLIGAFIACAAAAYGGSLRDEY